MLALWWKGFEERKWKYDSRIWEVRRFEEYDYGHQGILECRQIDMMVKLKAILKSGR